MLQLLHSTHCVVEILNPRMHMGDNQVYSRSKACWFARHLSYFQWILVQNFMTLPNDEKVHDNEKGVCSSLITI